MHKLGQEENESASFSETGTGQPGWRVKHSDRIVRNSEEGVVSAGY